MQSQALQKLVRKIFSDEETRSRFKSNPEGVLAQFALTEEEKRAVLNTHAKLGLVISDSQQLEAALDPTGAWSAPTP